MKRRRENTAGYVLRRIAVAVFAVAITGALFLILPVLQTIRATKPTDLEVQSIDVADLPPPPPPPPEDRVEEERPAPEAPPELTESAPPLDLSQLEMALNPTVGDGAFGDFSVKLVNQLVEGGGADLDEIFSLSDLDQKPRPIFQRPPTYPADLRRQKRQGTVYVLFTVDRQGRVADAKVDKSTDPAFELPAIEAVKQWKFEPGTRKGEPVQFRMRVPITFNANAA
jgi:protein TonB